VRALRSGGSSLRLGLLVALCLGLGAALASCGGDDNGDDGRGGAAGGGEPAKYVFASRAKTEPVDDVYRFSEEETSGEEFATEPPWEVHFAQYAADLPILAFFKQELEEYAKRYPNIKLTTSDGQLDPSKFVADIQSAISRNVDALIVEPADAQTAVPAVEQAAAKGIPVVAMQAEVASARVSSTVVASDIAAGRQQGEALVQELMRRNDGEATGDVIIVNGLAGHQLTEEQNQGFRAVLEEHPDIRIVCNQHAEFQPRKAVDVLENCLQRNPDADAVWYIGADVGPALAASARRSGRDGDEFFFVGGGGNRQTLGVMKREKGLIAYDYVYPGAALPALEAVKRLLSGESVPKVILIKSPGATSETVDDFLVGGKPYFGWPTALPEPWR
jgi:ribose transport system substrate-binding protein